VYIPRVKKLLWVFAALVLLIFFAFAWAPFFIRSYIERNYPGTSVGDASLRWQFVVLNNVSLNRDNVKASIPTATVDWDKNIVLYGGKVEVALGPAQAKNGNAAETKNIQGFGLDVDVTKGSAKATLKGVAFDATQVKFETGKVTYGIHEVSILSGSVVLKDKVLQAKQVTVPITIPFEVPRLEAKQTVELFGVEVDTKSKVVSFDTAKVGASFQTKKPSKVILLDQELHLELNQLEVNHPWVSPDPVTFADMKIAAPLAVIDGKGDILVKIGKAEVTIDPTKFRITGKGSCNAWVDAMPEPLPIALKEAKGHFDGDLSFEIERDPAPQLKIKNSCKFECKADPVQDLKDGRVAYMAYDKNDKLFPRTVGPRDDDWTSLANLPPHVPAAFITLEDPGFNLHRGVIPQALENSLKDNLRMGRFFRGGSTITMQLAKNIWLRRHKTLGRKAQEVLLTLALESCLSKAEILELYLNVVEFGPNLYGIGPASKFYFDHPPERLETDEAFYLASILPRPRKAIPPKQGGLERTRSLMKTLAGRGLINDTLIPLESTGDDTGWVTE
jgi:hypothetical protein